jgi:serine/threonine-protein kinase
VANLLEGSVRRSGNHLRVSTQLIRADSGQRLWSETFDREFKDVFTIQDEIAAAVVMALKVQLNGGSTAVRGHGTTNPEAYNAYLLGRQLYTQRTIPTSRQAIEAYQKAIDLDPRYADAYADLAMSQYFLADNTGDVALGRLAEQAAQKSIDLDPHLSTGYSVRGFLRYLHHYDWVGAESDFRQALALEPTNSRVLSRYGKLLSDLGRTEEATVMLRKAIEQDPLSTGNWQNLGIALAESRDHAAAYDAFHHALVIRPGDAYTTFALGTLQLIDGKAQEALATFQSNSIEEFRGAGVAMAEQTLGDAKASQQALDKLIATSAGDAAYQIAEVYGWRGEKDKAFEWLERAYRQQDGGITDIKNDLRLASLRSDPRYAAMLQRLNFPP